MVIFNTTFHIDDEIHEQCVAFLKSIYIPNAEIGGFLYSPRLAHIHAQHGERGMSYSLQFHVKDMETLQQWLSTDGKRLQQELGNRFGDKVVGFVTSMDEVEL